jgi:hypothetical protein
LEKKGKTNENRFSKNHESDNAYFECAMLNCRQVTRLVSQSMDARLAWHQRFAMRFHLLYCVWCRRYAAQVQFLRKASKGLDAEPDASSPKLSTEAKEKMRQQLQDALNKPPSAPR